MSGFVALADIEDRYPDLPVVIMTGDEEPELVREAFEHGALGFIPKSSPPAVILAALRLVLSGGTYVPPQIMASAIPVLPEVASITVSPGFSRPFCSASRITPIARRSLTEPPGLKASILTWRSTCFGARRRNLTIGVLPMVSRMFSWRMASDPLVEWRPLGTPS